MDQSVLSSRAIIGAYYARLEQNPGLAWVDGVSNFFASDQAGETYPFLGQSPTFREWIGGRQAKGLPASSFAITNKHYESTLEIQTKDARRDKTGQIVARMNEWVDRSLTHWASLLSTLLLNGATTTCYDGQYYFDTDHAEGDSGTQSNKIDVDISAMPNIAHGSTTVPSVEEMQSAIMTGIAKILSFVDNRGEPMNENAMEFVVITPTTMYPAALQAVTPIITSANSAANLSPNALSRFRVSAEMNPRINSWTDKFAIFRTDSPIKGLIRQQETAVELRAKAEGSEYEFDNAAWQFGIDSWRNVGYGYWQRACQVTLT